MKISGKSVAYDSQAFKVIFERLFPSMCMLASRLLKDEEKGKDIAQEAFVKLWQKKQDEEFADESALRAYLYVLVKNACLNQIQKESRVNNSPLENAMTLAEQEFINEVLREETYQLLREAIRNLSSQARDVIDLTLKGASNQEIADQLGVSLNTVKTVKKRAYRSLRETLGNQLIAILFTHLINFY